MDQIRKCIHPLTVTLWLTINNLFYLFNFSYIGLSAAPGIFLFIRKNKPGGNGTKPAF